MTMRTIKLELNELQITMLRQALLLRLEYLHSLPHLNHFNDLRQPYYSGEVSGVEDLMQLLDSALDEVYYGER